MAQLKRKMKKVISFILLFLMVINSTTVSGYSVLIAESGADISGQLLKENVPLEANDSVSVNDILTWRVTIDKNKLVEGIIIDLPDGIFPDITSGTLEGLTVVVNGNKVTVTTSSGEEPGVATGSAIKEKEPVGLVAVVKEESQDIVKSVSAVAVTTSDTQILDIPCKIDQSKVENGKINIVGLNLNVTDILQKGNIVTPDSVELIKKTGAGETTITSGATVSLNDSFILRMTWVSLTMVKASDYYDLVLPKEFGVPSADGSANIMAQNVPDGFPDLPFATISWKAGINKLHIEFKDMGKYSIDGEEYDALSLLGDASIDYECKLDESLKADDQGKITINLLFDSVTITASELVPKAPKLDKAVGTWNDEGEVEWTVTYTHPVSAYTGDIPTKLTDAIPTGLDYVENSAKVMVNGVDKTNWITKEDKTLICDLTNIQGGQTLTFTYKTKLTDGELQKIWTDPNSNISYTNHIVAKVNDVDANGVQGNSTASVSSNNWSGSIMINKDGNAIAPTKGETLWKINWLVTVKTASRNFKNLTLIDTMGEGLALDENSIKVVNEDGVDVSQLTKIDPVSGGKTQMTLDLVKAEVPATSEKIYRITYTTTVDQEYFDQTSNLNDDSIKNYAELKYEWPDGSGLGGPYAPPTVSKKPDGINNTMIVKSGKDYNKKDHSLTWEIKVNPNKVDLTQVELVDDMSTMAPKHSFVPEESTDEAIIDGIKDTIVAAVKKGLNDAGLSSTVQDSVQVELIGNKLIIKMSNLGKNSFTFQLKSYATDPSFYAGNASKTFQNKVTMTKVGTTVDGIQIAADISATATIPASSNVLTKEHVSYDPVTKKLTWRLIVNSNETDLGDVIITDELVDGLSCNADDATLNGGSFTGANTFIVDGTKSITINLSNVTSKQTITFTTTVDVDNVAFRTSSNVNFKNSAVMKSDTNSNDVKSETTLTLSNKALNKTAIKNDQSLTADYTVKLNPLGMDLLKGLPSDQKLQLEDTLPDGLYLDLDSVKLYNAGILKTTSSSNTYTVELTPVGAPVDTTISYDTASRTLTVDIPDASKGYILTYKTYIVRTGVDLKNDIRLVGSILPENSSIKNTYNTMKVASNGNAKMVLPKTSFVSLQIKKVNEAGNLLGGAVFGLYAKKTDAVPLVSATCDSATGISTLAIPKSLVKGIQTLYWKEIAAPVGYELNSEWHELDITNYDPAVVIDVINVPTGDAASAQIKMIKIDSKDSTKVLADAIFEIYTDKECILPVKEGGKPLIGTSDSNGIITFVGLYPNQTYYVREKSAPKGYIRSEQTIKVVAKKTWGVSDNITVTNEKADVTLNVTKVDALDSTKKLPGAEFQLYEEETCTIKVGESQTSIADGSLSFTGLFPNRTYYLKEIVSPVDYNITSDIFTITTGDNGVDVSKQIGNYLTGWNEKASIKITKTNEDGSKLLSGASFALYAQDKVTVLAEQSTDVNGALSFTGLRKGTYYVRESAAPSGYILSNEWKQVTLDVNEAVQLTITNMEIPPVKPTDPTIPTDPTTPTDPTNPSDGSGDPNGPSNPQVPENPKDESESNNTKDDEKSNNSNNSNVDDSKKNTDLNQKGANNRDGDQKDSQKIFDSSLPKTGVESHYVLWIACIILALVVASGLVVFWKRQNKRIKSNK